MARPGIDGGGAEGGMDVMVFGGGRPIQLPGPLKTSQASTEMGFKGGQFWIDFYRNWNWRWGWGETRGYCRGEYACI